MRARSPGSTSAIPWLKRIRAALLIDFGITRLLPEDEGQSEDKQAEGMVSAVRGPLIAWERQAGLPAVKLSIAFGIAGTALVLALREGLPARRRLSGHALRAH